MLIITLFTSTWILFQQIIFFQGVTQLHVDSAGRLFSCGADGSMKVRQLPERDCVVHTLY